MDRFTSQLTLSSLLKRNPVVYIEYEKRGDKSLGRYYTFNKEQELYHITYDIAVVLNMFNELYIVPVLDWRSRRRKCLQAPHPETIIRNLSQTLFLRWDAIEFYTLIE